MLEKLLEKNNIFVSTYLNNIDIVVYAVWLLDRKNKINHKTHHSFIFIFKYVVMRLQCILYRYSLYVGNNTYTILYWYVGTRRLGRPIDWHIHKGYIRTKL